MTFLSTRGRPEEAAERLKTAAGILRLTETGETGLMIEVHNLARQVEQLARRVETAFSPSCLR